MRKSIIVLATILTVASTAAALDFSAGFGTGCSFLTLQANYSDTDGVRNAQAFDCQQLDAVCFLDATYVLLAVSYGMDIGIGKETDTIGSQVFTADWFYDYSSLTFALYAKYPFRFLKTFAVSPLLGADFSLNLDAKGKASMTAAHIADLDDFHLIAGLCADYWVSKTHYLRLTGTYALNLNARPSDDVLPSGLISDNFYGHTITVNLTLGEKL